MNSSLPPIRDLPALNAASAASAAPVRVALLTVGEEILLGRIHDTNAGWLCRAIADRGGAVTTIRTVGDRLADIVLGLRQLHESAEVLLLTGGLGPTPDDLTREAIAAALEAPLTERAECLDAIRARFAAFNRPMTDSNRVQALVPEGAWPIDNPEGTAPGIAARWGDTRIFAMPGVPREMKRMFEREIAPCFLPAMAAPRTRELRLHGLGESRVGEILRRFEGDASVTLGTQVADSIITVRILYHGESSRASEALAVLDATLREALAPHVFGDGEATLASAVVAALHEAEQDLAVAESCTGGLLCGCLVDVPGASRVLREGAVTYCNEAKRTRLGVSAEILEAHGAVSEATAQAMASGIRATSGATWGLSITGIAGPEGGTPAKPVGTVWLALAGPNGIYTLQRRYLGDRTSIRQRAVQDGLDLLRRAVLQVPTLHETKYQDGAASSPSPSHIPGDRTACR